MEPVIKPTVLVIDDTGFLKDGDASACVGRQYTGTAGEVTNCQAGGSLHLASNGVSVAVNWRLFLPGSWDLSSPKADPAKAARRDKCAISAQVGHVEKWQLTLDMIDETRSWGIDVPQSSPTAATVTPPPSGSAWRHADSTTWWASRPQPPHDPRTHGRRPDLARQGPAAYPEPAQRVKDLVVAAGKSSARPVQWREGSRPGSGRSGANAYTSRFVALRIRPAGREIRQATTTAELPVRWRSGPPTGTSPCSSGSPTCPQPPRCPSSCATAKLRWRIENDYREMKQAFSLAHFEGRTWLAGLAPPRHPRLGHPRLGRPRLLHHAATEQIARRDGVGLSLYRVVRELQILLATWTGACPTCHRDMPDPAPT
ncbi:hypothetical protein GCM10020227_64760 [Streptomyces flavovirens]